VTAKKKAYESLNDLVENLYVMDLPQVKSENGKALLRSEYNRFKAAVENLTGVSITAQSLKEAIRTVNAKRAAIHRLSILTKSRSGTDLGPGCPAGQPGLLLRQPGQVYGICEQDL
jgi:benzoyl-CoA reductase/2-hydroxyglutaryl-CoA dehydratase subunit BcrC/BadD/HgdB